MPRIPASYYGHIPADVRCTIRRAIYDYPPSDWDVLYEQVQRKYGVPREVVARIMTTEPEALRRAYWRWIMTGRR